MLQDIKLLCEKHNWNEVTIVRYKITITRNKVKREILGYVRSSLIAWFSHNNKEIMPQLGEIKWFLWNSHIVDMFMMRLSPS